MEKETVESFDDEAFILKIFRLIPSRKIKYVGNFFRCWRVKQLVKSTFFSKSWVDSSKSGFPPDFHNDKHHIMLEIMRVDDGVGGKRSPNSFERSKKYLKKNLGLDYKIRLKGCSLYFTPDTRDDTEYNCKAYLKNFDRVLTDHSNKVDSYHNNYPKCNTCVFMVCDESNSYYQSIDKDKIIPHLCFCDKSFIDVIKKSKADFVIWLTTHKKPLIVNGKEIRQPWVCIYDVKHLKPAVFEYDHSKTVKIK